MIHSPSKLWARYCTQELDISYRLGWVRWCVGRTLCANTHPASRVGWLDASSWEDRAQTSSAAYRARLWLITLGRVPPDPRQLTPLVRQLVAVWAVSLGFCVGMPDALPSIMKQSTKLITERQHIRAFRREAADAGDQEAVDVCTRALAGDTDAQAMVHGWRMAAREQ